MASQILFEFRRRKPLPAFHRDDDIDGDVSFLPGMSDSFDSLRSKCAERTIDTKDEREFVDCWAVCLVTVFLKKVVEVHLKFSDVAVLRATGLSTNCDHACVSVLADNGAGNGGLGLSSKCKVQAMPILLFTALFCGFTR